MPSPAVTKWAPRVGVEAAKERQRGLYLINSTLPLTIIGIPLIPVGLVHGGLAVSATGAALALCSLACFILSLQSGRRFQHIAGRVLGVDTRGQNFIPPGETKYVEWCNRNRVSLEPFGGYFQ